jgi:ppGpp synthetase/RelA/SpoT-type nucleotidyltranferase
MTTNIVPLPNEGEGFDFEAHGQRAVAEYGRLRPLYEDLAACVQDILRRSLQTHRIKIASVDARAKAIESFGAKAVMRSAFDPRRPKYPNPMQEITDLAAIRVITFFLRAVDDVDRAIFAEFEVVEKDDKGALLDNDERFGYDSVHYLVRLGPNQASLAEYARCAHLVGEIQVRTILQHAWAEIEHDIRYKSPEVIPTSIRRRFSSLAGMLEIADREFQTILDDDQRLQRAALQSIAQGRLSEVELSSAALKAYLDRRLGPDGRMAESHYDQWVTLLHELGFANLQQVDDCLAGLDDRGISRHVWGAQQGQLTRFEGLLLAAMGPSFIERHPWRRLGWFVAVRREWLRRLQEANVPIGDCRPPGG